ncbi:helix-turn-helix domain-containing protein [Mycolicibacterium sp. XJ879]
MRSRSNPDYTRTLPPSPSIRQAANWLGVDQKTIRRYIASGLLKASRVGPRLIRIDRESLLKLGKPIGNWV